MTDIKQTSRKQAARNISIYAIGTIIRQLAAFIMLPVYTSYLTPADYGIVSLLVLMLTLFELLLGARFTQSIPKFYYEMSTELDRRAVISTALLLTSIVSLVSVAGLNLYSEPIARLAFDSSEYKFHVQLYTLVLFTAALEGYGLTYFRILEKPILFVTNSLCKLVLQLSLNIYFIVYLDYGVLGVVYSAVISSVAFGVFALGYIVWKNGVIIRTSLTFRLVRFSWPLWLGGLAGLYIGSSSQVFIKLYSDLANVGLFELGSKFAGILGVLIWQPFSQWWQTERFKLYQRSDKGVKVFPVVFDAIAITLAIFAMGLVLFSETAIRLMSDSAFHSASSAIAFLVIAKLFNILTYFYRFSFLVTEKTLFMTYLGYASALTLTLFLAILIPFYGFVGAAIAIMLNNFLFFVIFSHTSKRLFDNHIELNTLIKLLAVFVGISSINYFALPSDISIVKDLVFKLVLLITYITFGIWLALRNEKLAGLFIQTVVFIKNCLIKNRI